MNGIIDQFASQLTAKQAPQQEPAERSLTGNVDRKAKVDLAPVLQLTKFPLILDLDTYRNAQSATNPTGSLRATYALTQLAEALPLLGRDFAPSSMQLQQVYDLLISTARSDSDFTTALIGNAKRAFKTANFSGMGGIVEDWYPVYAIPDRWCELVADENNLLTITIDPNDTSSNSGAFQIINTDHSDNELSSVQQHEQLNADLAKKVDKIELKVMRVDFDRPWLNFEIFHRRDWYINGVRRRYYSNGRLDKNPGLMPLIISSMLVGVSMEVSGDFTKDEIETINALPADRQINLGPFALRPSGTSLTASNIEGNKPTQVTNTTTQVVGYISDVVPFCPFLPLPPKKN